ncbi:MAG: tyrosine-type recombinase/integrase [Coriobacteriales bacterium]|jgi:site-specific recombinase XerD|nr:tyrosine-type recombinase/integrase [Coriobacteriales bacterium]
MDNQKDMGKLPDLAARLYRQLDERHYSEETICCYAAVIRGLSAFMGDNRLFSYSEDVGRRYMTYAEERRTASWIKKARPTIKHLDDLLLGRQYVRVHPRAKHDAPAAFSAPLEAFLLVRRSSGIKETTLSADRYYLESFLNELGSAGAVDLTGTDAHDIRLSLQPLHLTAQSASSIRRFLAFAHSSGYTASDYSLIVPKPRAAHGVPSVYSPEEVAAVFACIDKVSLVGKRDYAMLLIAARLGMRRSDILSLTPSNIDCVRNLITLEQSKTGVPLELPLLDDIQEALADYIKNSRPDCTAYKEIFLGHRAPYEPLSRSGLTLVARRYFKRSGIDARGRRQGPHALRASLASGMLAEEVPYGAISKILGHTSEAATKSYIEIDIEQLRACALEVPPPSGAFALRIMPMVR